MANYRRIAQTPRNLHPARLIAIILIGVLATECAPERTISRDAQLLAPGVISTGDEYSVTMSPDASVLYFTRNDKAHWSRKGGNGWLPARQAAFAKGAWMADYLGHGESIGKIISWDPVISPDGSQLFFMSHGLVDGKIQPAENAGTDLWVMDRVGPGFGDDAWGPPRPLDAAINSPDHTDGALGISRDGTIYYFSSNRDDSFGSGDIYVSEPDNGVYRQAKNIGPVLNTEKFDGHTYPDPDERFLLFISVDRIGGYGDCDIYVTYKTESGWSEPVNLGPNVNSERCELTPSLSPDGKTLFFSRIEDRETDSRNIYFIKLADTHFSLRSQP